MSDNKFDIKCIGILEGHPNFNKIVWLSPGEFNLLGDDEYKVLPEDYTPEPTRADMENAAKQIAEQQEMIRKLMEQNKKADAPNIKQIEEQPDAIPQDLKDQYTTLFGKAPHHKMKAESILEAINKKQEVAA